MILGLLASIQAQDDAIYEEVNGIVVIEAESAKEYGNWLPDTSISNFTGDNYLLYEGMNWFNSPGRSLLRYKVHISKTGKYRFQWRSRIAKGNDNTEHNDSWLRIRNTAGFYAQKSDNRLYPKGSGMSPNPDGSGSNGWFKVYQNALSRWTWNTSTNDHNPYDIFMEFDTTGIYTIEISGRSNGHAIDRMVLYHSAVPTTIATDVNLPQSSVSSTTSVSNLTRPIRLWPNPATSYIEVILPPTLPTAKSVPWKIFDMQGHSVSQITSQSPGASNMQVPLDHLSAGTYYLILPTDISVYMGKFTKL